MATWSETSVSGWMTAFGLPYNANDPLQPLYNLIIANAGSPYNSPTWNAYCEACMRANGLLYFKTNPGDCQATITTLSQYTKNLSTISTDSAIAGVGISVGTDIASLAGIAGATALGAATAGVATVATTIISIFTGHHDAAVANEQATNCAAADQFNAISVQLDSLFFKGTFSGAAAYSSYNTLVQQAIALLNSVSKPNNWGYGTQEILRCMGILRGYIYGITALPSGVSVADISASLGVAYPGATATAKATATAVAANNTTPTTVEQVTAAATATTSGPAFLASITSSPYLLILIGLIVGFLFFGGSGGSTLKEASEAA